MHFFRPSTVYLDAFTYDASVIEQSPVTFGARNLPTWWKKLPKEANYENTFYPQKTVKTCVGISQFYEKSMTIPMWCDLAIKIENAGFRWQFSDESSVIELHAAEQFSGFIDSNAVKHFKIVVPWLFKSSHDVNWVASHPAYNTSDLFSYYTLPGVLNFKEQYSANIQIMLDVSKDKIINIPFRTPLSLLTPMTEKKVVLRRHLVGYQEYNSLLDKFKAVSFINSHLKRIRSTSENNCPYKDHIK